MKVAIGTDHRGREIKETIISLLSSEIEFIDCSIENHDTDDYPDFAFEVGKVVSTQKSEFGILICGTGIGMSIAANKVSGVRCALVHNIDEARLAKEHNDANVLAFGSNLSVDEMISFIREYMNTSFSIDEKHKRRVQKIINFERGEYNGL